MKLKKFDDYNYIKENIIDEDDENERNWEVKVDDETNSYWEYKYDAIEAIVEILDTNGDENGLEGYEDVDEYELASSEIVDMLEDMDESDFYEKLDELKEYVGYDANIKLINIDDDDEIEFLED